MQIISLIGRVHQPTPTYIRLRAIGTVMALIDWPGNVGPHGSRARIQRHRAEVGHRANA